MNYLAHIMLAHDSGEAMVGAFLGDFLRPDAALPLGPIVVREIHLHRHVDGFTDAHVEVRAARRLCPPAYRLFARISLDVHYDHLLATHWPRYCDEPMDRLVERFYTAIGAVRPQLPEDVAGVVDRMLEYDWLRSYREPASVDAAVARLARRLSRKGDHLIASLHHLRAHAQEVEAGFHRFFPQLQQATVARRHAWRVDSPLPGPRATAHDAVGR